MRGHTAPVPQNVASPPSDGSDTRLHGQWLTTARIGWLVVILTVVVLNLLALPDIAASQLTPQILRQLHQQNFSPSVYAAIGVWSYLGSLLIYLALSVLVFWRRSDERIALFCAVMLVTFGGIAASPLDDITSDTPMPQPLASSAVLTLLVHLLLVVGQVSFVTFFYLFPSGRFVPRWTRWCAALALVYWFATVFMSAQLSALNIGTQGNLILLFWLAAVIAQVYRYRRVSTPVEREQTKWVVFGFALAFALIVVPSLIQLALPAFANSMYNGPIIGQLIISNTWVVAALLIPIMITIAILRAHLWDIDVIINRALVYGTLTALLAAVYFACVIGAQVIMQALTGTMKPQPIVIVASTLLVAALFLPLRRRLQRTIDRRFFRKKYDAAKTLAIFGTTLRSETDLARLTDHLVTVVDGTMQPAHVSLWLQRSPNREVSA